MFIELIAASRFLSLGTKLAVIAGVLALAAGSLATFGVVKYNQGWKDAVAGVAARNSEAINAVRGAVSKVDDCSANGGFWDASGGVCR